MKKVTVFLVLLISGVISNVEAQTDSIAKATERFKSALQIINYTYVHSVDNQMLVGEAIGAMLEKLDPHSHYYSKEEYLLEQYSLSDKKVDIGIEFILIQGEYRVWHIDTSKISHTIGVQIGDRLLSINDVGCQHFSSMNSLQNFLINHSDKLIHLRLENSQSNEQVSISLHPAYVEQYGIPYFSILQSGVGYVKIEQFKKNTAKYFHKILQDFKKQNVNSLILDLRSNQGGFFQAAIDIADEFLEENQVIVFTQGESKRKEVFRSTKNALFKRGKLVIMVDHNSASASEILAGAIQDHGRGFIVGERTYGKALVQRDYFLEDSSVLRLSVAKYYTPAGKSIQRDYQQEKIAETPTESLKESSSRGGIKPDKIIKIKKSKLLSEIVERRLSKLFLLDEWDFVCKYIVVPLTQYDQLQQFAVRKEIYNYFNHYLTQQNDFIGDKEFLQNRNEILTMMKRDIISIYCNGELSKRYNVATDSLIQTVLQLLEDNAVFGEFGITY
jgi:carboxyl-terminal processing protease